MHAPRLVLLGLLLAAFGGCLNSNEPGSAETPTEPTPPRVGIPTSPDRIPVPDFDFTKVIDASHSGNAAAHHLPHLHQGSHGLKLVGYNPLTRPPAPGQVSLREGIGFVAVDTWGTYACVAQYTGLGGAAIVDLKDPSRPAVLAWVESANSNPDCQFTDDGKYLILAGEPGPQAGSPRAPGVLAPLVGGDLAVFDVADKSNPMFLFAGTPGTGQGSYHNLFTAWINGTHYVFHPYGGPIVALDPAAKAFREVARVPTVHDVWVGRHPITAQWIMATGRGSGVLLYDVSDPSQPRPLGGWSAEGGFTGWHRQWPLMNTVGGRALMVVAGESGGRSLPYAVLDFTDPEDLFFVGSWQVPGNPSMSGSCYGFSPHELETWDGYVATGNYHAGVWLFDIGSVERAREPVTLGYYLPSETPWTQGGTTNKITPDYCAPDVWGAYFDDRGYIVAADALTGLYVLSFDKTRTA